MIWCRKQRATGSANIDGNMLPRKTIGGVSGDGPQVVELRSSLMHSVSNCDHRSLSE